MMPHFEFRRRLRRAGLTQARFARLVGVNYVTVSHWATGKHPIPKWCAKLLVAHEERRINLNALEPTDEATP